MEFVLNIGEGFLKLFMVLLMGISVRIIQYAKQAFLDRKMDDRILCQFIEDATDN